MMVTVGTPRTHSLLRICLALHRIALECCQLQSSSLNCVATVANGHLPHSSLDAEMHSTAVHFLIVTSRHLVRPFAIQLSKPVIMCCIG